MSNQQAVTITYLNYKGAVSERRVIPMSFRFGTNEWYKEPQWLMVALDLDKEAVREFAMQNIQGWKSVDSQQALMHS